MSRRSTSALALIVASMAVLTAPALAALKKPEVPKEARPCLIGR